MVNQFDYFPKVSPGAIALGTAYSHATSFILSQPVLGAAFQRAKLSTTSKEFAESQEAATALTAWSSSLLGSGIQAYATSALLKLTSTVSYKAAAYIGGLVFAITGLPSIASSILIEKPPLDLLLAKVATGLLDTIGLSLVLTWFGEGSPLQPLR